MDLFEPAGRKRRRKLHFFLPFFLVASACLLFYFGVIHIGSGTSVKEQESLKQALQNGAVRTYALTGSYPQSLEELLQDYHITYDSARFIVEYVPNGSNLFPSISVLTQKGGTIS